MPNYNGVWSLSTQYQNVADWPQPPPIGFRVSGEATGVGSVSNIITVVTLSSSGAVADFGDLNAAQGRAGALSSTTRGIIGGGLGANGSTKTDTIQYFTIGTSGSGSDFGNLSVGRTYITASSNITRGIFAGGNAASDGASKDVMDYITIASAGNATDFGNLSAVSERSTSTSSTTRMIIGGGYRFYR